MSKELTPVRIEREYRIWEAVVWTIRGLATGFTFFVIYIQVFIGYEWYLWFYLLYPMFWIGLTFLWHAWALENRRTSYSMLRTRELWGKYLEDLSR